MVVRNILKSSSSTQRRKSLWLVCGSGSYRQDSGEAVLYFLFKINPAECFLKTALSAGCGITVEKKNGIISLLLFFSAALCRILSPIWLGLYDINNENCLQSRLISFSPWLLPIFKLKPFRFPSGSTFINFRTCSVCLYWVVLFCFVFVNMWIFNWLLIDLSPWTFRAADFIRQVALIL